MHKRGILIFIVLLISIFSIKSVYGFTCTQSCVALPERGVECNQLSGGVSYNYDYCSSTSELVKYTCSGKERVEQRISCSCDKTARACSGGGTTPTPSTGGTASWKDAAKKACESRHGTCTDNPGWKRYGQADRYPVGYHYYYEIHSDGCTSGNPGQVKEETGGCVEPLRGTFDLNGNVNLGGSAPPAAKPPVTPSNFPDPVDGAFNVNYYDGKDFNTYVYTRAVFRIGNGPFDTFNYPENWGSGGPSNLPPNQFSLKYSGRFEFKNAEYEFFTKSDDGSKLYVDNELIVNNWGDHGTKEIKAKKILNAGKYTINVEYYENSGGANLEVGWIKVRDISTCTPVDGVWSEYTCTDCSKTCGSGTQTCTRTCTQPSCGGLACSGLSSETRSCNTQSCGIATQTATVRLSKPAGALSEIQSEFTCNGVFDIDQNGKVDFSDFVSFVKYLNSKDMRGDFSNDKLLDIRDFYCFTQMFNQNVPVYTPEQCITGINANSFNQNYNPDENSDGVVNFQDFSNYAQCYAGLFLHSNPNNINCNKFDFDNNGIDLQYDLGCFNLLYGRNFNCKYGHADLNFNNNVGRSDFNDMLRFASCMGKKAVETSSLQGGNTFCGLADFNWDGIVNENDYICFRNDYLNNILRSCSNTLGLCSDFNRDGNVNNNDFIDFAKNWGGNNKNFDYNNDNVITAPDLVCFNSDYGKESKNLNSCKSGLKCDNDNQCASDSYCSYGRDGKSEGHCCATGEVWDLSQGKCVRMTESQCGCPFEQGTGGKFKLTGTSDYRNSKLMAREAACFIVNKVCALTKRFSREDQPAEKRWVEVRKY